MKTILNPLKKFLAATHVRYQFEPKLDLVRAGMSGSNGQWQFIAFGEDDRFMMASLVPVCAPEPRRAACAELCSRINARIALGHFEVDCQEGNILYRTSVPVAPKTRLHPAVIQHVFTGHHTIVDEYLPALSRLLFAGTNPAQALEEPLPLELPLPSTRFSLN